jgi:hypothetical protein
MNPRSLSIVMVASLCLLWSGMAQAAKDKTYDALTAFNVLTRYFNGETYNASGSSFYISKRKQKQLDPWAKSVLTLWRTDHPSKRLTLSRAQFALYEALQGEMGRASTDHRFNTGKITTQTVNKISDPNLRSLVTVLLRLR